MKWKKALLIGAGGILLAFLLLMVASYQPDIPVGQLKKKYANNESEFLPLDGMEVHYRDEGPAADSIPLVLLHGTSSSLLTWDDCTKVWSNEHRIIRMDLPGFALTGPNPNNDYSIDYYADFLNRFLERLNVKQLYLGGNSLGGLIAFHYAALHPEKVKKLILIDPAGYPVHGAKGSLAFTLGKIPVIKNILTIVTPLSIVRKSLEDAYGDKNRITDQRVELYRDMACREGNRNALLIRLEKDQSGDTTLVTRVSAPTLILWGSADQLIPVENANKFQRDLLIDTLIVFPDVGHVPMEESPELVIPQVMNFIRE